MSAIIVNSLHFYDVVMPTMCVPIVTPNILCDCVFSGIHLFMIATQGILCYVMHNFIIICPPC